MTDLVCSICRDRIQELVNSMTPTPRVGNFGLNIEKNYVFLKGVLVIGRGHKSKMHIISFKNLPLFSQTLIRQTKYIEMMTNEGSTIFFNIITKMTGP